MSRSRKKPYIKNTCIGNRAGVQKWWKKSCNRKLRRSIGMDLSDYSSYKRLSGDIWLSPSDGKHCSEDPRYLRK